MKSLGRGYSIDACPSAILNDPNILKNVPRCQAIEMERYVYPNDPRPYIVRTLWTNKICFQCRRKERTMTFYPCPDCHLAFYCSPECFEQAYPSHHQTCGKTDLSSDQIHFCAKLDFFSPI